MMLQLPITVKILNLIELLYAEILLLIFKILNTNRCGTDILENLYV